MTPNPFDLFTPQQKAMFYIMYKTFTEKLQTTGRELNTVLDHPLPDYAQVQLDLANFQLSIIHEMEMLFQQVVHIDDIHLLKHFTDWQIDQKKEVDRLLTSAMC